MRGTRLRAAALAGALLLNGAAPPALAEAAQTDVETRRIMEDILRAMQTVLPPSLDGDEFESDARRAEISAAIATLAANGARLERHAARRGESFAYLSRSLARDTSEIERRFAAGRYGQARFLLHHLTEVCVACHSQLPDEEERRLGRRLMAEETVASLPPEERVQFEMATRQFDAAARSFETLFADPKQASADIDVSGHFEAYLELCLRVRNDPTQAIATLEKFEGRADVPERIRVNLKAWIASLRRLVASPPSGTAIVQARALLDEAERRYHDDRRSLVQFVAASGILHRYTAAQRAPSPELGEAYYLMGFIEANVGRTFWASQVESFLETSIRIGAAEPYAREAFTLLEEFVVSGYSGSAGTLVPPDVYARLAELEELIDTAQPNDAVR